MTRDDVINEICSAYQAYIKEKRGYTPSLTPALKAALPKAADICMSINADPVTYVKAQAKFCALKEFYPNQLHTSSAIQNFQRYSTRCILADDESFEMQLKYLSDAIDAGRKEENVLMDDLVDLQPWFRILVSEKPIPEVIETFQEKALSELTPSLENFIRKRKLDISRIKGKK